MNSLLKDPRKNYQRSEKIYSNLHSDILQNSDSIWFNNKNGYLYLNFPISCGTFLRIGSWKRGLSIERLEPVSECWEKEELDHGIPLIPDSSENENDPVQKYLQKIPLNIRQSLKPFRWMQFTLLRLVYEAPEALELVQSNPVMIWMLADRIGNGRLSFEDGLKSLFLKRKAIPILEKGQINEPLVRLLSKIRFRNYTQDGMKQIRSLVHNPFAQSILKHAKFIQGENLRHLLAYPEIALTSFYTNEISKWQTTNKEASSGKILNVITVWKDAISLGKTLNIRNPQSVLSRLKTIDGLINIHDRWAKIFNAKNMEERILNFEKEYGTTNFPEPPIEGNDRIIPIKTIKELLIEGFEMHNCVGSYYPKIMSGDCYIYRTIKPSERTTIELVNKIGEWFFSQMRTNCNGEVSRETRILVSQWVNRLEI